MFKKFIAICSFTVSFSANAAMVSYNGYSLDTATNVVVGESLEWLQWDETVGKSINQALTIHSTNGWRLATLSEMTQLLNDFNFGTNFTSTENNTPQTAIGLAAPGLLNTEPFEGFITMFGPTFYGGSSGLDPQRRSIAHFGTDENNNGWYGRTSIYSDYQQNNGVDRNAQAVMYGEISTSTANYVISDSGVALVREVTPVPVPAAAWFFASALIGLAGISKKKSSKVS